MNEMISTWIRESGLNPIALGWLIAVLILALITNRGGRK